MTSLPPDAVANSGPAQAADDDRIPGRVLGPESRALSPSSRQVLERANGFRLLAGDDAIHMEHLLAGLLTKPDGPTVEAFRRANVPLGDVPPRLREIGVYAPTPTLTQDGRVTFVVRPQGLDAQTALSRHVAEAVDRAMAAAGWTPDDPRPIRSRHLLAGVASVTRCRVVKAFARAFAMVPEVLRDFEARDAATGSRNDVASSPEQARTTEARKPEPVDPIDLAKAFPDEFGYRPDSSTSQFPNPVFLREPSSGDSKARQDDSGVASAGPAGRLESVEASLGVGDGATNDRPERAEDRLEFAHYITAFADLVESPDTKPPITIGIFGSWGAGKSFLLHHLQRELRRRERTRRAPLADTLRAHALRAAPRLIVSHAWTRSTAALARGWRGVTRGVAHRWRRLAARWTGATAPTLPPDRRACRIHSITFNAWEYSATERIWPRLVRAILEHVERDVRWSTRPRLAAEKLGRKLRYNVPRKLRSDWMDLVAWLAVGAAGAFVALKVPGVRQSDALEAIFGTGTGAEFTIPAAAGAFTAFAKLVRDTILAPLGGWMTALLDDGVAYGGQIDYMAAMKADLDLLERRLRKGRARVLVMIDDLDRCEPDKMIQVLQAVNLLLDRESFVVCLGVDARVVTAAVEKHYKDLLGPAGITGYEYLDKIVQIPFRIPEPTKEQLEQFLGKQLGAPSEPPSDAVQTAAQPSSSSDVAATSGGTDLAADGAARPSAAVVAPSSGGSTLPPSSTSTSRAPAPAAVPHDAPLTFSDDERRAFTQVAAFLRPNPRHINRLINVYALVRSLTETRREHGRVGGPSATVRWLVLAAQWPYAVRQMLVRLDELLRETPPPSDGSAWRPAASVTDSGALAALLGGASLSDDERQRFDWDPARLESLVADSAFVTWDQIRLLRRYTLNFNPALDAELRVLRTEDASIDRRELPLIRKEMAKKTAATAPVSNAAPATITPTGTAPPVAQPPAPSQNPPPHTA